MPGGQGETALCDAAAAAGHVLPAVATGIVRPGRALDPGAVHTRVLDRDPGTLTPEASHEIPAEGLDGRADAGARNPGCGAGARGRPAHVHVH